MLGDKMQGNSGYIKLSVLIFLALLTISTSAASLEIDFKDSQKSKAFINTAYSLNFDVIASSTSTDASDLQNPSFTADFQGTDLSVSGDLDNCDSIDDKEIITPDLTPGIYTLSLTVSCEYPNGSVIEGSEDLQINVNKSERAKATQNPAGELTMEQIRRNGLSLDVEYWSGYEKKRPQADNFYLNVFKGSDKVYSKRKWFTGVRKEDSVELNLETTQVPELETGDYRFEVMLKTDEMSEPIKVKDVDLSKNLVFSGTINSPDGGGVKTKFDFGKYSFETDENGKYSERIKPGTYDMTLEFPETTVELDQVEIKEDYRGGITYGYYSIDRDLNVTGLDAVNLMGIAFGYPVQNASITTEYDFGNINWKELEVFECQNWNLGRGCHSNWKVVDSSNVEIIPWSGESSFPVNAAEFSGGNRSQKILINSYVIGRNQPMRLSNFQLESEEIHVNKDYKVQGFIESGEGTAVEDAEVDITVSGVQGTKSFKAETDQNGKFETDINLPKVGDYSLTVKAEKPPYSPVEKSTDKSISVVKNRELSISSPSSFEIDSGTTKVLNATLENTGQADVKNIDVSASVDKIETSMTNSNVFNSLSPGESSKISLNVTVPSDFCKEGCDSYPSIKLKAKGDSGDQKVEESSSVTLVVSKSSSQQSEREGVSTDPSFSIPDPSISGNFMSSGAGINKILGGALLLIILAIVIVKKRSSGVREPRRGLVE